MRTINKNAPDNAGNIIGGTSHLSSLNHPTTGIDESNTLSSESLRFFGLLFRDGDNLTLRPMELWAEDGRKWSRVAYDLVVTTPLAVAYFWLKRIAAAADEQALNQFFGVCPRFEAKPGFDKAWQIRKVTTLWADIDHCSVEDALDRCESKGVPVPSIVVSSGNGVHLYWLLDSPYLIDDVSDPQQIQQEWGPKSENGKASPPDEFIIVDDEKIYLKRKGKSVPGSSPALSAKALFIQDVVAGIADAIGGDHTQDLSRLLRLPGTLNRKNQRMGAKPTECRIHSTSDNRYAIGEFDRFASQSPSKVAREKIAKVKLPAAKKMVPQRTSDRLRDLVNSCAIADPGSRSEQDFALCCYAIEKGIPQDVVWSACHDVGKFAERGEAYFQLTWSKAEQHTREEIYRSHLDAKAKRKLTEKPESTTTSASDDGDPKDQTRPTLHVTKVEGESPDEDQVTDEVILQIARLGVDSPWIDATKLDSVSVYQRCGQLVHVVADPDGGELRGITIPEATLRIRELPRSMVRERITQAVTLLKQKTEKHDGEICVVDVKCTPPAWLIASVAERGQWPAAMRQLSAIVRSPTIRPDGTILDVPGYDPRTMLLYAPNDDFPPVPERPTQAEIEQSVELLAEVVCDYPFLNKSCKSAWVSLVLTLLGRTIINGPCPLFLFDANTRGSGKSLLCDVAYLIAYGSRSPRKTWPADDDAEVRKTITSVAVEGVPAVVFDNVVGAIGGAAFDAALTSTVWQDRLLGSNKTTGSLPLTTVWMASGNNLELLGDSERRTLFCRIESPLERPEDREDFRHPHLVNWVTENRGKLAVAALTLWRGWFVANCPKVAQGQWGSYEAWSNTVRQVIVWSGLTDPCQTKALAQAASKSSNTLELWHAALDECDPDGLGITSSRLFQLWGEEGYLALKSAISETISRKPSPQVISSIIRRFVGSVRKGRSLTSFVVHGGAKAWKLSQNSSDEGLTCHQGHQRHQMSEPSTGDLGDSGDVLDLR